jgi:hypothetical protein
MEEKKMLTNKLLAAVAAALLMTFVTLVIYSVPLLRALAPTENANPRIIYWPPTVVWTGFSGYPEIGWGELNVISMSWSPSGRYLLIYGEVCQPVKYVGPTAHELMMLVVDMENGKLAYNITLARDDYYYSGELRQPVFSPDETKIFYVRHFYSNGSNAIYAFNVDGSSVTRILEACVNSTGSIIKPISIDITGDGLLVFSVCESMYDFQGEYYRTYVWKYNLTSGEKSSVIQLETKNKQELRDKLITSLRVSPSNDKIAFTTCKSVYIVNLDGTGLMNVSNASEGNILAHVDWTPNGTMLTYSEFIGEVYDWGLDVRDPVNMFAVNLDGTGKHAILDELNGLPKGCKLVWSPTNSSLAAYIIRTVHGNAPYLIDFNMPITPNPDSDGDGISDFAEIGNFLCPLDPTDVNADYDNDGLTNLEEINHRTYLGNPDFDDDGLSDGVEVKVFRTDPTKKDTDGDGVSDGLEAAATGLNAFVSVLPDGWIRMQLEWSNKTMYVSTNSSVLGVIFNSTSMALTVSVGGSDGTTGIANITIPVDMISSLSAVKVTLDNQPIDFQISQTGRYAQIHVQYHHSFHDLTAHLKGEGVGIGGVDLTGILGYWWLILSVAIVAVASIIAFIVVKRG